MEDLSYSFCDCHGKTSISSPTQFAGNNPKTPSAFRRFFFYYSLSRSLFASSNSFFASTPNFSLFKYCRIFSFQFPCEKERRPVNVVYKYIKRECYSSTFIPSFAGLVKLLFPVNFGLLVRASSRERKFFQRSSLMFFA